MTSQASLRGIHGEGEFARRERILMLAAITAYQNYLLQRAGGEHSNPLVRCAVQRSRLFAGVERWVHSILSQGSLLESPLW